MALERINLVPRADTPETVLENIETAYNNLKEYAIGMQEFQADLKAPDTTFSPNLHMLICSCQVATEQLASATEQVACDNCAANIATEQLSHGSRAGGRLQLSSCYIATEQLHLRDVAGVPAWQPTARA
ncbi:hypothetical protein HaLaN_28439 [Haematococcus lacustris]|uniref:Uncharacterized protein n=1 Tax=Haematococcus lacustris TaxID=44745 RepID=A0A6A0AD10_HAELA|nr:hypothetical protein HaLaN_28439 [Haematococcus lacustris]